MRKTVTSLLCISCCLVTTRPKDCAIQPKFFIISLISLLRRKILLLQAASYLWMMAHPTRLGISFRTCMLRILLYSGGVKLAHNRGHQNALLAGLMTALHSGCDAAISMDDDLQDDVNVVDEFIKNNREGDEIVYGVRSVRKKRWPFAVWCGWVCQVVTVLRSSLPQVR